MQSYKYAEFCNINYFYSDEMQKNILYAENTFFFFSSKIKTLLALKLLSKQKLHYLTFDLRRRFLFLGLLESSILTLALVSLNLSWLVIIKTYICIKLEVHREFEACLPTSLTSNTPPFWWWQTTILICSLLSASQVLYKQK